MVVLKQGNASIATPLKPSEAVQIQKNLPFGPAGGPSLEVVQRSLVQISAVERGADARRVVQRQKEEASEQAARLDAGGGRQGPGGGAGAGPPAGGGSAGRIVGLTARPATVMDSRDSKLESSCDRDKVRFSPRSWRFFCAITVQSFAY